MADTGEVVDGALDWLLDRARPDGDALLWPGVPEADEVDPTLYSGAAGIAVTLLEAHAHTGDDRFADAALATARGLVRPNPSHDLSSLHFGLSGLAFVVHTVGQAVDDAACRAFVSEATAAIQDRFDGERWADQFELLGGNAGIALAALAVSEVDLAVLAVEPYLRTSEPTRDGVHWEVRQGTAARFHHVSHGTLGIVHALASVAAATGRSDLLDLALAGAADVVGRDEAGSDGFLVPHSDPQHRPDVIERYSYGWCHGPAGDAQVFRLLAQATGDEVWNGLVDRCRRTVVGSGLPERLRPGFWDNNGRCCGTAGVLALECDLIAEGRATPEFAHVLVEDLLGRATSDAGGVRWCNHEHRADPPTLSPRTGWAMGVAGIVRELMRYQRLTTDGDSRYAVTWPDQPPV